MVARQVKPLNEGAARPQKGRMTWAALAAIVLFVLALAFVILRPIVDRRDGPEREPPQVNAPRAPASPS
ncbi:MULTISPECIES: hypothetical protein [unclassified Phenylobacterium]|uniref:hypothetical protein n=1 Tax=unclassified Phenylobacterium TaxID=2640670 RepID=UPI000839F768|nr:MULTISPECIES: hypothetical protein [unclassified Phenylobacterium]